IINTGNGSLSVALQGGQPAHGTVDLRPTGAFIFTPEPGFVGEVTFQYVVVNNDHDSSNPGDYAFIGSVLRTINDVIDIGLNEPATVTIKVGNKAPKGEDDSYSVRHDSTLISRPGVLANDKDEDDNPDAGIKQPLSADLVGNVSHGVLDFRADGTFRYVP